MAVNTTLVGLSQTVSSNGPDGTVDAPSTLDDAQRYALSFIATLRDGKGFTNPVTLASATTTDIGAQNSVAVEISGTTTITSFGTSYNGPRYLRFTGALLLTHNATTLNLPGAANITTAAGDTAIAYPNLAANGWNVVAYQSASGIVSINTGQIAGIRNAVINGNGLVQTRTAPTLTAALQYGAADRHLIGVTSGTSVSGTAGVLSNAGFSCGVGYGAIAASWTTGQFIHKHRIESVNTKQFNSKTVTVSGKIYQDTGGSRNFTVSIGKPTTTADTFSAVTNLGTSGATAVASATVTSFSYTLALAATDASLGLEILFTDNAANTVVTKNYAISDLQIEIGSVASVFEQIDYQVSLARCRRYLPAFVSSGAGSTVPGLGTAYVTTSTLLNTPFEVEARVAPTGITVSAASHFEVGDGLNVYVSLSALTYSGSGKKAAVLDSVHGAQGQFRPMFMRSNSASGLILFTGCEL